MSNTTEPVFDVVEALCQHHSVESFTATKEWEYEKWLDTLWERSVLPVGDRVLVATKNAEVRGFMASIDFPLNHPVGYEGVYFYISAVAVSDGFRGTSIFAALAQVTLDSADIVEATRFEPYRGILASPGSDRTLQSALRTLGFHPVPTTDYWAKLRAIE